MIRYNENIAPHTTFRIGGKAAVWADYQSDEELIDLLRRNKAGEFGEGQTLPILPVGEGSNLLFVGDYKGLVLHSKMMRAKALKEDQESVLIEAQSGLKMDDLIAQLCDMGLSGMENLSYIPGTVGAAAVQNVGAYRTEAKDIITSVRVLDTETFEVREIINEECHFAYRDSWFKHQQKGKYIVLAVTFRLQKDSLAAGSTTTDRSQSLMEKRNDIIATRRTKLPEVSEMGSAGSFFKNPIVPQVLFETILRDYPDVPHFEQDGGVKIPAAWLIDTCGFKGKQLGSAAVYEKQPLVIVNTGGATADEIIALANAIIDEIKAKFGITLSPEVEYIH